MAAVRTVWLYRAAFNIDLQVNNIMGVTNTYADILSRWHTYEASDLSPVKILKKCNWEIVDPRFLLPDFSIYAFLQAVPLCDGLHGLEQTVVIYFEYLAQNNIRACSMRNHL